VSARVASSTQAVKTFEECKLTTQKTIKLSVRGLHSPRVQWKCLYPAE
jgi:hypothetical protein